MTDRTADTVFWIAIAYAAAALAFVLLVCGCVTRTTVCVETAHGLSPHDGYPRDSVGGSVCAEFERP